jgi:hypothetical protein
MEKISAKDKPSIEAVFAHAEQTANRVDPPPLIERLQN